MALREIDGGPDYFSQFANSLPSDPNYFPDRRLVRERHLAG